MHTGITKGYKGMQFLLEINNKKKNTMPKIYTHLFLIGLLIMAFSISLEARLEDHFKRAEGKSHIHTMRNIDFIYMINLDQRPEKFNSCNEHLNYYGIFPYRFSAVNGWELSLQTINDVGLKFAPGMQGGFLATSYLNENLEQYHSLVQNYGQTYFCHCMARGTIGIALSHLSVLQDAYNSGYNTIWVMEDDIQIKRDPRIISDLIARLDARLGRNNWDILFTDQDIRDANGNYVPSYGMARRPDFYPANQSQYNQRVQVDNEFRIIGSRFGAHSMIVRRSGMIKILNFMKAHNIFLPYDMDFYLPEGIKLVCVLDDVVTNQPKAISDNGGPNYLNKKP